MNKQTLKTAVLALALGFSMASANAATVDTDLCRYVRNTACSTTPDSLIDKVLALVGGIWAGYEVK